MFLLATVQDKMPRVHCYTSHFFNILDDGEYVGFGPTGTLPDEPTTHGEERPASSFRGVKNWSDQMDGGINNVDDLFVPINVRNIHWLFLHVNLRTKTIRLYDSLWKNAPVHTKYLLAIKKYLYDEEFKRTLVNDRPPFRVWKRNWDAQNRSGHSPTQGNGDDCGVFTLLSIYLLSRGVQISSSTYDQHIVTHHMLRHNIASALMKASDITPAGSVASIWTRSRRTTNSSAGLKKRKREESRVALGKSKIRKDLKLPHNSKTKSKASLINRKRSAKSLSDTPSPRLSIAQLLMQPPKKPRKAT